MKSSSAFLQFPLKLSSDVFGEVKACAISMLSLHPANRPRAKKRCCADVERLQICSLPALDLGSSISLRHLFAGAVGGTTTAKLMVAPSVSSTLLMLLFSSGSLFWRTSIRVTCLKTLIRQATSTMTQLATASDAVFCFGSFFWHRICASVPGHEETYLATFIEKMEKGGHGASHLACISESFEGNKSHFVCPFLAFKFWKITPPHQLGVGHQWVHHGNRQLGAPVAEANKIFVAHPTGRRGVSWVTVPPYAATDPKTHWGWSPGDNHYGRWCWEA